MQTYTTTQVAIQVVYRVVTRNINETYSVVFEGTKSECRKYISGRWGHWPPFAAITTRDTNFHCCF